ncbi:MAG: DNRLRE domain-containing protein [Candidatus Omnitrophica bacterium]|nr:DNRLRE domain-containing protein [Candidatus Omnitrophota bacterium]
MRKILSLIVAVLLFAGYTGTVSAATHHYEFDSVNDTFVSQENPLANYDSNDLEVGDDYYRIERDYYDYFRTYVGWSSTDIASIVADTITNAYIRLYAFGYNDLDGTSSNNYVTAYQVTSAWSESGLNWSTQPGIITSPIVANTLITGAPSYYMWDVTVLTTSWWDNSAGNYGVMLGADMPTNDEVWVKFYDYTEGFADYRPKLIIDTYKEDPPPPPPIPEPATMIMLGSLATGLFGMAGIKKRLFKR